MVYQIEIDRTEGEECFLSKGQEDGDQKVFFTRRNRVRFFRCLSMRRKDREVTNIIEILQIIEKAKVEKIKPNEAVKSAQVELLTSKKQFKL